MQIAKGWWRHILLSAFVMVTMVTAEGSGALDRSITRHPRSHAGLGATDGKGDPAVFVQAWLKTQPKLRPLSRLDSRLVRQKPQIKDNFGDLLQPYYAVGDFNHDGVEDVVIGVAYGRAKRDSAGAFVVFNGRVTPNGRREFYLACRVDAIPIHDHSLDPTPSRERGRNLVEIDDLDMTQWIYQPVGQSYKREVLGTWPAD